MIDSAETRSLRLLGILGQLMAAGCDGLTVKELSILAEVSPRSIQRDIVSLREMGVALTARAVYGGKVKAFTLGTAHSAPFVDVLALYPQADPDNIAIQSEPGELGYRFVLVNAAANRATKVAKAWANRANHLHSRALHIANQIAAEATDESGS